MTSALVEARVVNTRALHQAPELDALLRERGAIPLSYPCLTISPPADEAELDETIRALWDGHYDWLVVTSTNAVHAVADRLAATEFDLSPRPNFKIAAVGEATASVVTTRLDLPITYQSIVQQGTALALSVPTSPGDRVLMLVSPIARPEPATILRERGAAVTSVVAYRNVVGNGGVDLPGLLRQGGVDAITFTSPSAITGCLARLAAEGGSAETLSNITIVTIGPTTDQEANMHGLTEAVMSPSPSLRDLVETLDAALSIKLSIKRIEGEEAWLSRSTA